MEIPEHATDSGTVITKREAGNERRHTPRRQATDRTVTVDDTVVGALDIGRLLG
jgi:hypothetical protein